MTLATTKIQAAATQQTDTLPAETIKLDLTALVIYAGATWDFHRYHYDAAFTKKIGMEAPFVDGQMIGGLLASRVMRWCGKNAFVRKLGYRQRAMVYVDESVVISGRVTSRATENGRRLATFNLSVNKPDGTPVVRDGIAVVDLGPE